MPDFDNMSLVERLHARRGCWCKGVIARHDARRSPEAFAKWLYSDLPDRPSFDIAGDFLVPLDKSNFITPVHGQTGASPPTSALVDAFRALAKTHPPPFLPDPENLPTDDDSSDEG